MECHVRSVMGWGVRRVVWMERVGGERDVEGLYVGGVRAREMEREGVGSASDISGAVGFGCMVVESGLVVD